MCAISSKPRQHHHGFTLPELIAVIILLAILSVAVLPRLQGSLAWRDLAWRDQIVASLRHAHRTAHSHRRLVCATIDTQHVTLQIAANHPATNCAVNLPGPDGAPAAKADAGANIPNVTPSGVLYFQPSGRISSDGAGQIASSRTITIGDLPPITVVGETGYVY